MSPTRVVLGIAAIVLFLGAGLLSIRDVEAAGANCGSALLTRDPLKSRVLTGDAREDAFQEQRVVSSCKQAITEQRFYVAIPVAVGLGCVIIGRSLRAKETAD